MDDQIAIRLAKLKQIRVRKDLKYPKVKYLKETYTDFAGEERPLVIRYYQVQGIMHLMLMKRFLLGDDTGTGKTLESIGALCVIWEKEPQWKVIVLTTKSATRQWADEFTKFTRGVRVLVCKGNPKQRDEARKMYLESKGPTVMIMGYRSACVDFTHMQNWKSHILITDEASAYKNPKTRVHQVCRHLGDNAERVWALTATMIKNHLMEGYGIFQVLIPGLFGLSEYQFKLYYALTQQRPIGHNKYITVIVGYLPQKIQEFKEIIDPYFLGRAKHDVASELPTLTSRTLEVDLTDDQEDKYFEALEGMLEMVKEGTNVIQEVSKLTAIVYCQEIVGHLGMLGIDDTESPKIEALIELLTEGDFAEEKIIVFSRFEKMISFVMDRLRKEKIPAVRVTGKENEDQRRAAMKVFQDPNSDTRVICITTAGSEAINLQAAKALVCLDTPWSAGDFLQLVGRMIRIGSEHDKCYVIHMVARRSGSKPETVDHRIMEVLGKKMHLIEAVLGKRIKGDDDQITVPMDNDISDLFATLKNDARKDGGV
jgi:SWI/SNF-related matrix-associated actin-dependent regulator 1 of chromatin subfamily A